MKLIGLVLSMTILGVMFVSTSARAGEIYSFLLPHCELATGLVTAVSGDAATVLTLEGGEKRVAIDQVQAVYIYSYINNPVPKIDAGPALLGSLKRVWVDENDVFTGWPIRFVESLVMFIDTSGKQHVHELNSITRIRPAENDLQLHTQGLVSSPVSLSFRDLSAQCPNLPAGTSQSSRPMRVLSDPIKVRQLMDDLKAGYDSLADYEERTYLYARPFLFEKEARFGIALGEQRVERQIPWPLDFRWSSGKPFHFQSFTDIGTQFSEFSPYAQQFFGVRSDLKAHVFHMHFEGNVAGIPAGTSVYKTLGIDGSMGTNENFGGRSEVQTGMNYLLLMGGDYGPLSLSAGYYYPDTAVRVGSIFREVLASKKSYAFRVMWTEKAWRVRAIVVPVIDFSSLSPTSTDLAYDTTFRALDGSGGVGPVSFSYKGRFFRTGIDYDWSKLLQTSLDFLYHHGEYQDVMSTDPSRYYGGTAPSFASDSYTFDRFALTLSVRQDFGDYIGVRLSGAYDQYVTDYNMGGVKSATTWAPMTWGGAIEFVF